MKKWIFLSFLVMASIFCVGWLDREENYSCETIKYRVSSGDTIWRICNDCFDQQNRYKNFDEFVFYTRKSNNLLGTKFIKPGDVVEVKLYTRKPLF